MYKNGSPFQKLYFFYSTTTVVQNQEDGRLYKDMGNGQMIEVTTRVQPVTNKLVRYSNFLDPAMEVVGSLKRPAMSDQRYLR